MLRWTCRLLMLWPLAVTVFAQQINWKRDHIYNGPGGKEIATVTPSADDSTPPTAPTGLSYASLTATSVELSWTGSTDPGGSGVAGYKVYRQLAPNGPVPVGTVAASPFVDRPLKPSQGYSYFIIALDHAQNHSGPSNTVGLTTLSSTSDTLAPSTPPDLRGRALSATSTRLDWYASADAGGSGLAGYQVYRGGVLVSGGSPIAQLFFEDSGLTANTAYSYTVKAVDNNSNGSPLTAAVNVTTGRTILFQDYFNRPDAATLGSPWVNTVGTVKVGQNSAYIPAPDVAYSARYSDAIQSTQTTFKATVTINYLATSNASGGIAFYRRWDSGTSRFVGYRATFKYGYSGNYITLYWFDNMNDAAAIGTAIASGTISAGYPSTFSVETNAATGIVKVSINGAVVINTTIPTGNMTGGVGITGTAWTDGFTFGEANLDNFLLEQ